MSIIDELERLYAEDMAAAVAYTTCDGDEDEMDEAFERSEGASDKLYCALYEAGPKLLAFVRAYDAMMAEPEAAEHAAHVEAAREALNNSTAPEVKGDE